MKSGMDARPKFWCLGGSPLLPLTWPQSKGDLLAVGEPPTAGLRPHEPHRMDVLQNFWQLLSELQFNRRVKIQCPGARIRLGLALPVPSHAPLTKFIPQSQCCHLLRRIVICFQLLGVKWVLEQCLAQSALVSRKSIHSEKGDLLSQIQVLVSRGLSST